MSQAKQRSWVRAPSFVLSAATWVSFGLAACGEDKPNEPDAGHHHHHDASSEPDGGYPDVPCDPSLPPLEVGTEQLGTSERIRAKVVSVEPLPLLKGSSDWVLDFTTPEGEPVNDVEVTEADTFMPVHGHFGPFAPRVELRSEPGRVSFDRFTFNMRGPWQVRVKLASESAGDDYVIFEVCVEPEI